MPAHQRLPGNLVRFVLSRFLPNVTARALATVSLELIERALELEEDAYFSRAADARLAHKEKRIAHELAWK